MMWSLTNWQKISQMDRNYILTVAKKEDVNVKFKCKHKASIWQQQQLQNKTKHTDGISTRYSHISFHQNTS